MRRVIAVVEYDAVGILSARRVRVRGGMTNVNADCRASNGIDGIDQDLIYLQTLE